MSNQSIKKGKFKISIIGAGRVGSALSIALFKKGFSFLSVVDLDIKKAAKLKKVINAQNFSNHVKDLNPETNLLFITTPDDKISDVVSKLNRLTTLNFSDLIAIHTSGVHSVDVLKPLELKGARIISFHPIQTFTLRSAAYNSDNLLENIFFGVETQNKNLKIAKFLAKSINSRIIYINKKNKSLYHIACVFASNYIITNLYIVELLSQKIGIGKIWKEAFKPLIEKSVINTLNNSPTQALTGPVERGDIKTIQNHIEKLKVYAPELLKFYCLSGIVTLDLAIKKKSLSAKKISIIKKLFTQYL